MLGGSNTAVLRKLAQSGEQWQSPVTVVLMLSRLWWEVGQTMDLIVIQESMVRRSSWSDLHGDYALGFGYRRWPSMTAHNVEL